MSDLAQPKPKPRKGRKPAFDRQAAVEAVAALFWESGYDGVSLSDVMTATSLSKSSLYNSFGDKDALFEIALAHYGESVVSNGAAWLSDEDGSDPFEKLDQLLSGPIEAAHGRGCFLCNTAADGPTDRQAVDRLVSDGFGQLGAGLLALLRRAAPNASEATLRPYAQLILTTYTGLNVRSRADKDRAQLVTAKQALLDLLDTVLPHLTK